ncbi:hypothetical protein SPRG_01568 [Saprolegnia parasitica CBS 223.65]|uniref:WW domain-containing protein n=1 Tax=Saprolegnia parasitica (strain CBS 223.65) TaxID=695850 RepID=A0A067CV83_SAPPC|nr:hypothetical protein SPRG_01568 [Saprolegnia parasitica CBS 223.65]KDO34433.1 hypothetical protein SPRG_01568 [Saprolegnia parasitica CBS 223.65]|eukprot:XP_012195164.1 hypothetical protein SPRG_01568 [Saprolegnia parasitica CBS 223.65]
MATTREAQAMAVAEDDDSMQGLPWVLYHDSASNMPCYVNSVTQDVLWGLPLESETHTIYRVARAVSRDHPRRRRAMSLPDLRRSITHHTYGRIDLSLQLVQATKTKDKKVRIDPKAPALQEKARAYLTVAHLHCEYMTRFYHENGTNYSNEKYRHLHAFRLPPYGSSSTLQEMEPSSLHQSIVSSAHYRSFVGKVEDDTATAPSAGPRTAIEGEKRSPEDPKIVEAPRHRQKKRLSAKAKRALYRTHRLDNDVVGASRDVDKNQALVSCMAALPA